MAISKEDRDKIRMILSGQSENPVEITTAEHIDWADNNTGDSEYMSEETTTHSHDEQPAGDFAENVVNILATRVGELSKENALLMAKVMELQSKQEV